MPFKTSIIFKADRISLRRCNRIHLFILLLMGIGMLLILSYNELKINWSHRYASISEFSILFHWSVWMLKTALDRRTAAGAVRPGPVPTGRISLRSLSSWLVSASLGLRWGATDTDRQLRSRECPAAFQKHTFSFSQNLQWDGGRPPGVWAILLTSLSLGNPKHPELSKIKVQPPFCIKNL